MGKPRLIILVRHAQSEGNKNRAVHQTTPDHRVKLTPHGHKQAAEAGKKLMGMLRPDDTIQFYTSPYLRTRETTKGMLGELESHPNYSKVKVFEEPRLREQDFGNFQPCAAEMERMWHERAAYGHFFYRIPNGESAADAYDRVSVFNESLWRQFADDDFASVLVLVTHGLMTRIFLMKWYHYSVEYFEDLRNVNHCEFILMERSLTTGKYILQSELRTWSAYKKEQEEKRLAALAMSEDGMVKDPALLSYGAEEQQIAPPEMPRRWGGCVNGCSHAQYKWYTYGDANDNLPTISVGESSSSQQPYVVSTGRSKRMQHPEFAAHVQERLRERLGVLEAGRDFGGSKSGAGSDVEDSGSGGEDDILERVKRDRARKQAVDEDAPTPHAKARLEEEGNVANFVSGVERQKQQQAADAAAEGLTTKQVRELDMMIEEAKNDYLGISPAHSLTASSNSTPAPGSKTGSVTTGGVKKVVNNVVEVVGEVVADVINKSQAAPVIVAVTGPAEDKRQGNGGEGTTPSAAEPDIKHEF